MRRRTYALGLILLATASAAWVSMPVYWIRPFVAQTEFGLRASYVLREHGPWVAFAALVVGCSLAVALFRSGIRWFKRTLVSLLILVLAASAWFAGENHFEWMYAPYPEPAFVEAGAAAHVADDDLVIGIVAGSESRAYPVRALAYHHIVNDVAGGEPVVVTY